MAKLDIEEVEVDTIIGGDTTPIGLISGYISNTPPTNWMICDGSAISRTTYADLFALIGTQYGAGDASTTFNLPDVRRRVPLGKGSSDTLGDDDGVSAAARSLTHTHSTPNHSHSVNSHTHSTPNHSHSVNGHTHSTPNHSHSVNSHTHSTPNHSHSVNSHTHSMPSHSHLTAMGFDGSQTYYARGIFPDVGPKYGSTVLNIHRVSFQTTLLPGYSVGNPGAARLASTDQGGSGNTGSTGGSTNNSGGGTTGSTGGSTNNSGGGTTGSTGGSTDTSGGGTTGSTGGSTDTSGGGTSGSANNSNYLIINYIIKVL